MIWKASVGRFMKKSGVGKRLFPAWIAATAGGVLSVALSFGAGDVIVLVPDDGTEEQPPRFCWYQVKLPKLGKVQACLDAGIETNGLICTQCPKAGECLTPQDEEGQNRFINVVVKPDCVFILTFQRGRILDLLGTDLRRIGVGKYP
jgi:hypothetical protein